jgi:hypothetical protein
VALSANTSRVQNRREPKSAPLHSKYVYILSSHPLWALFRQNQVLYHLGIFDPVVTTYPHFNITVMKKEQRIYRRHKGESHSAEHYLAKINGPLTYLPPFPLFPYFGPPYSKRKTTPPAERHRNTAFIISPLRTRGIIQIAERSQRIPRGS